MPAQSHAPSKPSGKKTHGHTQARLWTRPLRELTPQTSYGYRVITFARLIGHPLDPWQEWAVIHAGELLPDGRPRFRKVLLIVARQNGKTTLLKVLTLFWLFVQRWPMILGMSSTLAYARDAWSGAIDMAKAVPELAAEIERIRLDNNDPHIRLTTGSVYRYAAANRKGGRSLSVDRLVVDELREHRTWAAMQAALPTMNARPFAQAFLISNQGDDQSVVLNSLRQSALDGQDEDLGVFEWSSPAGSSPLDVEALAAANPNLGYRLSLSSLLADAKRAVAAGGDELTGFKTEIMCMRVPALDPAVDPEAWADCYEAGTLDLLKSRVALCIDVSPDMQHVTLTAAAVQDDGRCRVEVVKAWDGAGALAAARAALPALAEKIKPKKVGWMPNGPAASMAADLKTRKGRYVWPPRGVVVEEIAAEVPACCMGLAELVKAGEVVHSGDPLLDAHVTGAGKLYSGDRWYFSRKGGGHCDAAYSAAGAVHLARTLPTSLGKPRILRAAS